MADARAAGGALRVAILARSDARRRALAARIEAAGHVVVEEGADILLADAELDGEQFDQALRAAANGLLAREPEPDPSAGSGFRAAGEAAVPLLTPRELEILAALGEGLSNKGVARKLGISAHTVKFHLETIFRKLGVSSRAEAVAKGMRQGMIEL